MSALLLYKILSVQLAWLGSIGVYLSSKQQVYLHKPLPKQVAWPGFILASVVASVLLTQLFHWLTASIFVLLIWSLAWIILALWSPHYPKAKVVFSVGTLLMFFTALLGGAHVV